VKRKQRIKYRPEAVPARGVEEFFSEECTLKETEKGTQPTRSIGRKWAWLMLGLGHEPNRLSRDPDFARDALSRESYLPSQPVFHQSAAGFGSNRKSTPSAGTPSREGDVLSESGSNPRTGPQESRQAL